MRKRKSRGQGYSNEWVTLADVIRAAVIEWKVFEEDMIAGKLESREARVAEYLANSEGTISMLIEMHIQYPVMSDMIDIEVPDSLSVIQIKNPLFEPHAAKPDEEPGDDADD